MNNCEQWLLTRVVDRVQHNIVEQCAAQHCNKLLTTLTKLFIFACVKCSSRNTEIMSILCVLKVDNPVSILNQDTSRNFLFASDEKKKYKVQYFHHLVIIVISIIFNIPIIVININIIIIIKTLITVIINIFSID